MGGSVVHFIDLLWILQCGRHKLYWDGSVITDRTIVANKPDFMLVDRLERRSFIVDVTVPHNDKLVKAEKLQ